MKKIVSTYGLVNILKLILSANRALLCEVRANMRRVSVEYFKEEHKAVVYFFYDSPPTQDELDYDVEGTINAEMGCDFPFGLAWQEESFIIPYPQPIPNLGEVVFQRYEALQEKIIEKEPIMRHIPTVEDINRGDLILSGNRALLGEIRPNMRQVAVEYREEERKIILHFWFDTPLTSDELECNVEAIKDKMRIYFPPDIVWETASVVLPYPQRIPDPGGCIFAKYEPRPPEIDPKDW